MLLVSTSKSFIFADPCNGTIGTIDTGKGLYYGITYTDDYVFVAARNNKDCFNYLDNRENEDGSILVFDYELKLVDILKAPFKLRDLHQIIYFDDKLWMTCAFDNMIAIFDCKSWEKWYPSEKNKNWGKDINHFNSLWVDKKNFYILAHNNGPSEIWCYSYPELILLKKKQIGFCGHNIWKLNNDLFTCNSHYGTVDSVKGFSLKTGNFPRGVVINDQNIYIGVSDVAERSERHLVSSSIFVYDSEWNYKSKINLKGLGQVLDIRSPGVKDICASEYIGKTPVTTPIPLI